jgi:hypothetical protein
MAVSCMYETTHKAMNSLPAAAGISTVWSAAPSPNPSVNIRSAWFCRSGSDLRKKVIWLGGARAGNFTAASFRRESNEILARSNQINARWHGGRERTRTGFHSGGHAAVHPRGLGHLGHLACAVLCTPEESEASPLVDVQGHGEGGVARGGTLWWVAGWGINGLGRRRWPRNPSGKAFQSVMTLATTEP